ncbi:UNVERIFIED_CONTAM: hypothetical protein RMT77_019941 [Armadillidium vulgare]
MAELPIEEGEASNASETLGEDEEWMKEVRDYQKALSILRKWLKDKWKYSYPSPAEMSGLAVATGECRRVVQKILDRERNSFLRVYIKAIIGKDPKRFIREQGPPDEDVKVITIKEPCDMGPHMPYFG